MPSRRSEIEMTPAEIRTYLHEQNRLILTSNGPDGYPHPMPMNFCVDDQDRVVITTFRKSQKVKNFQRDPRAALLVESGLSYQDIKSVLMYAHAEIIDEEAVVLATMQQLGRKAAGYSEVTSEEAQAQIRASVPKRVVIRFKPTKYVSWDHTKLRGRY